MAALERLPLRRRGTLALAWIGRVGLAALAGCGGTSPLTVEDGALVFTGSNLAEGQTWKVDAGIELRFSQPIDFASVGFGTVHVEGPAGAMVLGDISSGALATGEPDPSVIRFVPTCYNLGLGDSFGLQPGGQAYTLRVQGADGEGPGIISTEGIPLEESFEIGFRTPASNDPADLFHDPLPTPAAVLIQGAGGVGSADPNSTYVEIGASQPKRAYFSQGPFGQGVLTLEGSPLIPNGLPLNHRIAPANRVAFVIHFDQPIAGDQANIDRVGMEYLDVTWHRLRGASELLSNCEGPGYAVRFHPEGFLPRGTPLRIAIEPGLRDRGGQVSGFGQAGLIYVETTSELDFQGAPSDAIYELFLTGGDQPGSFEDTSSPLAYPRAFWGNGALVPQPDGDGRSMAQSKWVHIGYGKIDPGMPDRPAEFFFGGTDETGAIVQVGGAVLPSEDSFGPVPLVGIEANAVTMDFGVVPDPTGLYIAHPALLRGTRVVFLPGDGSVPGGAGGLGTSNATVDQGMLRLLLSEGCFIPGVGVGDCVPLDLPASLPTSGAVNIRIVPQFFEVWNGFQRDTMPLDSSVRILFDGAMAGADGEVDPTTALSQTSGWTADPAVLSSEPWDFVRFQVLFDLDASANGWSMAEGRPVLNFVKLVHDHGL